MVKGERVAGYNMECLDMKWHSGIGEQTKVEDILKTIMNNN